MVVVDDLTFGGAGLRVHDLVEVRQLQRVPVDLDLLLAGRHGARVPQLRPEVTDRSVCGRAGGPEGTGPGSPGDFCTCERRVGAELRTGPPEYVLPAVTSPILPGAIPPAPSGRPRSRTTYRSALALVLG